MRSGASLRSDLLGETFEGQADEGECRPVFARFPPRDRRLFHAQLLGHVGLRESSGLPPCADLVGGHLYVGPGEKMVLVHETGRALFVWRKFLDDSGQQGVNCAVFRNEGAGQSSELIREAAERAWQRWPGERLYTYVRPDAIRSTNPGFCFIAAGWHHVGWTKGGLRILALATPHDSQSPREGPHGRAAPNPEERSPE
jgi:hypothetical protein